MPQMRPPWRHHGDVKRMQRAVAFKFVDDAFALAPKHDAETDGCRSSSMWLGTYCMLEEGTPLSSQAALPIGFELGFGHTLCSRAIQVKICHAVPISRYNSLVNNVPLVGHGSVSHHGEV